MAGAECQILKIDRFWLIVLINTAVWMLIHFGVSWWALAVNWQSFQQDSWLYRARAFEQGGNVYQKWLRIKLWKSRLPDGASWFKGGFSKQRLAQRNRNYLIRFIAETRRSELAHWAQFGCVALFAIWNDARAMIVISIYGLILNLPCILVQRYNRFVLLSIVGSLSH